MRYIQIVLILLFVRSLLFYPAPDVFLHANGVFKTRVADGGSCLLLLMVHKSFRQTWLHFLRIGCV